MGLWGHYGVMGSLWGYGGDGGDGGNGVMGVMGVMGGGVDSDFKRGGSLLIEAVQPLRGVVGLWPREIKYPWGEDI